MRDAMEAGAGDVQAHMREGPSIVSFPTLHTPPRESNSGNNLVTPPTVHRSSEPMDKLKVFVGNVSWNIGDTALFDAFSPFGRCSEAHVVPSCGGANYHRGFGFVTFEDAAECATAISTMNGKELDGRKIICKYAFTHALLGAPQRAAAEHTTQEPSRCQALPAWTSQNIVGTTPVASWQGWQPADDTLLSTITFAILDTETTGLSKKELIAEIAIKKVRGDGTTFGATWSTLVNPAPRSMEHKPAPHVKSAFEITGLSDAMLREPSVPKFATIHSRVFQEVGEGCVVVAHNASFDQRMLAQSCVAASLPQPPVPWICSLILARKALAQALIGPDGRMHAAMPDICRHYGVVIRDAHRASGDVEALAEVFPRLLTTLQHHHNVYTWGQLQRFMDKGKPKPKQPKSGQPPTAPTAPPTASPTAAVSLPAVNPHQAQRGGGGGGGGGAAAARKPLHTSPPQASPAQTCPQNSPPYDAAAPLGSHPFDSPTRKWNGNMSGPFTRHRKPNMTSPLNYSV